MPDEFADLVESGLKIERHFEDAIEGADVVMILRIQRERQDAAFFPSMREYAVHYRLASETSRTRGAGRYRDASRSDESRRRDFI